MPEVSIICPIYNEEPFIEQCINSVLQQDLPPAEWELLLVDGMSTDLTRRLIEPYLNKHTNISLLDNPHKTAPYAMNLGINAARGEYIVRIDTHADYPSNYVSTLLHYLQTLPDAANVGAVCRTLPRNNTKKAQAIVQVMSSRFGVGNAAFRTGVSKITEVDTVPFGCFRKQTLIQCGGYDERLTRNQDIELNKRISQAGGKIYLIPDVSCSYYVRSTYKELAHNNYQNGKWNILTVFFTRCFHSLSIRHFVPLLFLLSLIIPLLFMPLYLPIGILSLLSLLAYIILIGSVSANIAYKKRVNFFCLLTAFFTLHISYGFGSLIGFTKILVQ
ncbi:MAG: glycosyltransferase family 2 protein [Paludibacteraceae bacterium]|nr:glycosyltransferase family 2 protein [Paludibacteraceae bacterium]